MNTVLPKVSVIMPAYNSATTIQNSADSVLAQTYTNLELIIINDGSSDETLNIITSLYSKNERVVIINQDNLGVSAARNNGLAESTGEWVAFCDADDEWFKGKLLIQSKLFSSYAWSYTDSYYVGVDYTTPIKRSEQSNLLQGDIHSVLIKENFLTTSSIIIKKDILAEMGGFDESMAALEDWDLWLNIARLHPIGFVNQPLLNYLVVDGSTSRKARKMVPLHEHLISKHTNHFPKATIRKALAQSYLICSYIAENSKDYRFACRCAWLAFVKTPANPMYLKRLLRTLTLPWYT